MDDSRQGIGILGGSFDPVHNGHLAIAKSFLSSDNISELWVLLTPDPPHKPEREFSDYQVRFKMLQTAFQDMEGVSIKDFESRLPKPSYTVQTLEYLSEQYPDEKFYLCIGEDSLKNFKSWYKWRKILQFCDLLVARRPSAEAERTDDIPADKMSYISHNPMEISSTEIRQKVANGLPISSLVPPGVEALIKKNNLYKNR